MDILHWLVTATLVMGDQTILLATYGLAKGWVEFWLLWILVDAVRVPLLISAGYHASAAMYVVYGAFCLAGFSVWMPSRVPDAIRTPASVG
jgi:nicotinamide mononucleotide transporter